MSNSSLNPLISSLLEDGRSLKESIDQAKAVPRVESLETLRVRVKSAAENLLRKLKNPQFPSSCPEKVIHKVLDKIQATLLEFIKFDPSSAGVFETLIKNLNDCKPSPAPEPEPEFTSSISSESPTDNSIPTQPPASIDDQSLAANFDSLSDNEKRCLKCLFLFPKGMEAKKRELIHLWFGMDLINDPLDGAKVLAKLLSEGFIGRTIGNRKLYNRYKMNPNVWTMANEMHIVQTDDAKPFFIIGLAPEKELTSKNKPLLAAQKTFKHISRTLSKTVSSSKMGQQEDAEHQQPAVTERIKDLIVLNKDGNTLISPTASERLSKRKHDIKVLHLGVWDNNPKRYIMVEEMENLKALIKHMVNVTFLSLEGISGIVNLPDVVYKLDNLKVLDLRACPNLESLPEGIESLKELTHLDLSHCYLLDHIPKGISSLTKLKVLKGYVINPSEPAMTADDNETETETENENEKQGNITSCGSSFKDLSDLKELMKLTIRTRRNNFPTNEDIETLITMKKLTTLRIAWIRGSADSSSEESTTGKFPSSIRKLELQAAPENTMSRLLKIISKDSESWLEKLYIRGGGHWELGIGRMHQFSKVETLRLRYLPELQMDWEEVQHYFPNLTRLEVLGCPNLMFFPIDENGVWEGTRISDNS